ncbi:NET1-associated nuclear protein 1 [Malassezia psittaci]|uniref:NET1-associated nuclear protein 1 n=1 Tax=Malassezia psittaci TaxID=1821823 RepID=A0AAF0JDN0_9BASI|nr:NET1-associated nuclear protein 1 [Malassezia psittaci]
MPARKKDAKEAASRSEAMATSKCQSDVVQMPVTVLQDEIASNVSPVFTKDGSYFFLVRHCSILIVSRATNCVVATLSDNNVDSKACHTASITGMQLSPWNPLQLFTCSLDGTLKVWNYLDSELSDDLNIGLPISAMTLSSSWKSRIFVVVSKDKQTSRANSRSHSTVYSVELGTGSRNSHKPAKQVRLGKLSSFCCFGVSPNGKWLIALSSSKVNILSLEDPEAEFVRFTSESRLTALSFHPDDNLQRFATGEENGKIRIWYCLEQLASSGNLSQSSSGYSATTTLHWHAHAVSALQYSSEGAQLLSGGEEGVLVVWKLSSGNAVGADAREFVPRLGAGITALAVTRNPSKNEQEYVACLADGSAVFVASLSLKVVRTFATVKNDATRYTLDDADRASLTQPLALDRAAGLAVLTAGHPSTLQFVDIATQSHILDVEIVPTNRVSRPEDEALAPPRVQHVAFSLPVQGMTHGEWMATVDGRPGGSYTSELSLKLWQWNSHSKTYQLNTRIDHPHEKHVTALSFSPRLGSDGILLATVGDDGQVKTWRVAVRTLRGERTESYWICRSAFSYRGTIPRWVTWSPDGSLLAIAQGVFITLWDPVSLVMQTRLAAPELGAAEQCVFVGRHGRFLAAVGSQRLLIWDLVGQRVVYAADYPALGISPHRHGLLVLAENATTLLYIRTDGQLIQKYVVPELIASSILNVAPDSDQLHILALNKQGALLDLGSRRVSSSTSLQDVTMNDARATLFDELFGVDAEHAERIDQMMKDDQEYLQKVGWQANEGIERALALFSAPPNLLPPVTSLADAYIDALLPPAYKEEPQDVANIENVDHMEEDPERGPESHPAPDSDQIYKARSMNIDFLADALDSVLQVYQQPASNISSATTPKSKKRHSSQ